MHNLSIIEEFYENNFDMLVKKTSRRAGSIQNAEDVVQNAFERALVYFHSYDPSRPFDTWFSSILMGCLADFKKDERRAGTVTYSGEEEMEDPSDLFNERLVEEASFLLKGKPLPEAVALNLYFFKGYKLREASNVSGLDYRRTVYAITKFREELALM